jgi:hypothetical protein
MNNKIFNHIVKKLHETWNLPKHSEIRESLGADTVLDSLPWTPVKKQKFKSDLEGTFGVVIEVVGTVEQLVDRTDDRYLAWLTKSTKTVLSRFWMWVADIIPLRKGFLTWWVSILIIIVQIL